MMAHLFIVPIVIMFKNWTKSDLVCMIQYLDVQPFIPIHIPANVHTIMHNIEVIKLDSTTTTTVSSWYAVTQFST